MKSYKFLCCVFALSMLMCMSVFGQSGPGKAAYLQAKELQKANKLKEAVGKYEEAIRLEPQNYKYYFENGVCCSRAKEYDWAKEAFKKSIELNKDFTPAYTQMAKIYKMQGDLVTATKFYEQAVENEKSPNRKVQYELLLVQTLLKQERVEDAKAHLSAAEKIDPTNMNINFYKAELLAAEGRWDDAKTAYATSTESEEFKNLPPAEKAKYYYGLGIAYSKLGENDNAKKAWEKANFGPYKKLIELQLLRTNHLFFYKTAISYYLNNEFDEGLKQADKCLEIQNDYANAYILKGKIERKKGNLAKAIEYYETAIKVEKDPANKAKMYGLVANLYMSNNDPKGALNYIADALTASPDNKALQFLKARAEYETGKYADAIADLDKLVATAASDAKAKAKYSFLLGMAAKKNNDAAKAKLAFKDALYGPYKPAARAELEQLAAKK
ncbi:MAG: tetratricopeptide repeat protein [Bacteroidia bacterium]